MKKNLLISILMIFINHLIAYQPSTRLILTEEESQVLAYLQKSYKQDKLFYKSFSDGDLVYSLDILSRKIQFLNKQALPENSKRMKPFLIAFGLVPLSVAAYLVTSFSKELYALYTQFKLGKFKNIYLPLYTIDNLASKTISKQEKRYLKRFSFEQQYFQYTKDPFAGKWVKDPKTKFTYHISQEEVIQNTITNLSPAEKEKIKYLALRSAITSLKWQMFRRTCFILIMFTISVIYSIKFFDDIVNYETKIKEEIKLNKEIYNLLKKEQERYQY